MVGECRTRDEAVGVNKQNQVLRQKCYLSITAWHSLVGNEYSFEKEEK